MRSTFSLLISFALFIFIAVQVLLFTRVLRTSVTRGPMQTEQVDHNHTSSKFAKRSQSIEVEELEKIDSEKSTQTVAATTRRRANAWSAADVAVQDSAALVRLETRRAIRQAEDSWRSSMADERMRRLNAALLVGSVGAAAGDDKDDDYDRVAAADRGAKCAARSEAAEQKCAKFATRARRSDGGADGDACRACRLAKASAAASASFGRRRLGCSVQLGEKWRSESSGSVVKLCECSGAGNDDRQRWRRAAELLCCKRMRAR